MNIRWSEKAFADVERLFEFLVPINHVAATRVVRALVAAPNRLRRYPRLGEQLFEFQPREVRRILVGDYEIRYEIRDKEIFILRIWHTREER
ncbi:MAG: type II toxin-antitoxin system RelE/ParE family toxin [Candidatus Hydrogenedentes bacterium]|nr:type II toxin-antitoxin system RelE/ParE family toxin [Candidatus Hydrogenedentota bacterium]